MTAKCEQALDKLVERLGRYLFTSNLLLYPQVRPHYYREEFCLEELKHFAEEARDEAEAAVLNAMRTVEDARIKHRFLSPIDTLLSIHDVPELSRRWPDLLRELAELSGDATSQSQPSKGGYPWPENYPEDLTIYNLLAANWPLTREELIGLLKKSDFESEYSTDTYKSRAAFIAISKGEPEYPGFEGWNRIRDDHKKRYRTKEARRRLQGASVDR